MSKGRLENKLAVVTGAAQGIGEAIVNAYVQEGAEVIAVDINQAKLKKLSADKISTYSLDVSDANAVKQCAAANPRVNVLVNCAGVVSENTAINCEASELFHSFSINAGAMLYTIQAFLPNMLNREGGSIINIASVVSSVTGVPNRFAYGTTKAAVIGLTKSVAADFIDQQVRCNSISPGTIESPSLVDRIASAKDPDAARRAFVARQPMGRLGTADEIAAVAVLLGSDEVTFMTGENIIVDGGFCL